MTPLYRARGGRTFTAAERGLEAHRTTDHGEFVEGQTVRLNGEIGPRYTLLGFRADGTADLYPATQSGSGGQRTVAADRLRKVRGG